MNNISCDFTCDLTTVIPSLINKLSSREVTGLTCLFMICATGLTAYKMKIEHDNNVALADVT